MINKLSGFVSNIIALLFRPISLIIIAIILIVYFGFGQTASIYPSIPVQDAELISETSQYVEWKIPFVNYDTNLGANDCDSSTETDFLLNIGGNTHDSLGTWKSEYSGRQYVGGYYLTLQADRLFPATEFEITGLSATASPCTDRAHPVVAHYEDVNVYCELDGDSMSESRGYIRCAIKGKAVAEEPSNFYGVKSGYVIARIYKKNYEPTDSSSSTTTAVEPSYNSQSSQEESQTQETSPQTTNTQTTPSQTNQKLSFLDKLSSWWQNFIDGILGSWGR